LVDVSDGNAGAYTVVVSNVAGSVTSSAARLTVLNPPVIATQPISRTNASGTRASFSVGVSGNGPFAFQWLKNGAAIPGATRASLILKDVSSSSAGGYDVIASNAVGSATSSVATLTVLSPPSPAGNYAVSSPLNPTAAPAPPGTLSLAAPQWRGEAVTVRFPTAIGHWYELQASADLKSWTTIALDETRATNGWVQFRDPDSSSMKLRFYRVLTH
jgi:hypothetical protein